MSSYHRDFKLNGISFFSTKEMVAFSQSISDELTCFLREWFSSDPFICIKTSGSTGAPKNIQLQKTWMIESAVRTASFFELPSKTTALCCLPIDFIAGKMMVVRALTHGWYLDIITPNSFPLKNVCRSYDFAAMIPLQVSNSLDKIHLIQKLIVGGGVISCQLEKSIKKLKSQVFATYGMTETISHIAIKILNGPNQTSSYQVLSNIEIGIDHRNCLIIKAPGISSDIIVTNDIIELISETKFIWKGRFDNIINSGGVKLHPEVLEKKISSKINRRFFVAGIPDNKLGEKLILIIEGHQYPVEYNEIFAGLSKFEIPKQIFFIERFIETKTKKIQRLKTLNLLG